MAEKFNWSKFVQMSVVYAIIGVVCITLLGVAKDSTTDLAIAMIIFLVGGAINYLAIGFVPAQQLAAWLNHDGEMVDFGLVFWTVVIGMPVACLVGLFWIYIRHRLDQAIRSAKAAIRMGGPSTRRKDDPN